MQNWWKVLLLLGKGKLLFLKFVEAISTEPQGRIPTKYTSAI